MTILQEITLVSSLAISPVNLEDSGLYTCQSGFNSQANVTVIVISGNALFSPKNSCAQEFNFRRAKGRHLRREYSQYKPFMPNLTLDLLPNKYFLKYNFYSSSGKVSSQSL